MRYEWLPWEQPALESNTDYGIVSASSVNTASANTEPYHISDGVYEGLGCSWESAVKVIPAWVKWKFPVKLKITKLSVLNKYTSSTYCTKDLVVYVAEDMKYPIGEKQFECKSFSRLDFEFDTPVITDTLVFYCASGYSTSNQFVGIGEVFITAEQGVALYDVNFRSWDGRLLYSELVEYGGKVKPPTAPERKGYTFVGWSVPTDFIVSDVDSVAVYKKNDAKESSILEELKSLFDELGVNVETGVFSETPPDTYIVLTPLSDRFDIFADNRPEIEVQEVRISLFTKSNYTKLKNTISRSVLDLDMAVTDKRYIGHEDDTGYFHYAIDVAKQYIFEEE